MEIGGFLQVSGITYKIDSQIPASMQENDRGVWVGAPTGGYRVHDVQVYNKETDTWADLDLEKTYNLAGYNYTLRDLGDGFGMFQGAVNVLDYVMEDYLVLANYIQAFPDGLVDATNSPLLAKHPGFLLDYASVDGSGRILFAQIKAEQPQEETVPTQTPETQPPTPTQPVEQDAQPRNHTGITMAVLALGVATVLIVLG